MVLIARGNRSGNVWGEGGCFAFFYRSRGSRFVVACYQIARVTNINIAIARPDTLVDETWEIGLKELLQLVSNWQS